MRRVLSVAVKDSSVVKMNRYFSTIQNKAMMMPTKIEWTDKVWNPTTGCIKVSPGCYHCYAERMSNRLRGRCGYPEDYPFRVTLHLDRLEQPFRWKKPRKVFVDSMGDLFHKDVPFEYIAAVFGVMAACPQHTFQILTKRPDRMMEFYDLIQEQQHQPGLECAVQLLGFEMNLFPEGNGPIHCKYGPAPDTPWPLPNVWLGVTAENQKIADKRIPLLLQCPAAVHFVSAEPLLENIDFRRHLLDADGLDLAGGWPQKNGLGWIIVGGETGPGARPMHPDWVRTIRDDCQAAGVPFFFKGFGDWACTYDRDKDDPDWRRCPKAKSTNERYINLKGGHGFHGDRVCFIKKVGKKKAGRILDGRTWDELPV